jgi:hypothetical protein
MRSLTQIFLVVLLSQLCSAANAEPLKFMGLAIEGKTIAFVCDGSKWTKNKIDDLADELTKTIEAMQPDQRLAVIFFADDKAFGPSDGKLLVATDQNKRKAANWLEDVELGDKSTPMAGLSRAFEAKPDAVVFVSSGEFGDYDTVQTHVNALNKDHRVRVYTIGFFRSEKEDDSRPFIRLMEQLAEQHRGKSATVYADELRRKR